MKIVLPLTENRDIARTVGSILDQNKANLICFVGHKPSGLLVSVIETLISQGYCHNMVVTNLAEGENCHCGGHDCACRWLKDKLLPDNVFLFDKTQNPDLVKMMPKLGNSVTWVINADHPQQEEIIQRISS